LSLSGVWGQHPHLSWTDHSDPDIDHFTLKKRYTNTFGQNTYYVDVAAGTYSYDDPDLILQRRGETTAEYWVKIVDLKGQSSSYSNRWSTLGLGGVAKEVTNEDTAIPEQYELYNPWPNPFNPVTTLRFGLPEESNVSLKVYDVTGKNVADLVSGHLSAGYHSVVWDASTNASGLYFVKLTTPGYSATQKLMLVK